MTIIKNAGLLVDAVAPRTSGRPSVNSRTQRDRVLLTNNCSPLPGLSLLSIPAAPAHSCTARDGLVDAMPGPPHQPSQTGSAAERFRANHRHAVGYESPGRARSSGRASPVATRGCSCRTLPIDADRMVSRLRIRPDQGGTIAVSRRSEQAVGQPGRNRRRQNDGTLTTLFGKSLMFFDSRTGRRERSACASR